MQPIGKDARDVLDPFTELNLRKETVRARPARAGTAGNDRANPLIEGRRDEGSLSISRMTGERDLIRVHKRKRLQVIDAPARGPGAPSEFGPVMFGPNRLPSFRIVARVGSGINAADVTAADRDQRPASMGILRDEDGE